MRGLAMALLGASVAAAASPAERGYPLDVYLAQVDFEELALAPDAHALAFITRASSAAAGGFAFDVWRVNLTGDTPGTPERLTREATCSALAWSPDGRVLSFLGPDPVGGEETLLVAAGGGMPVPLVGVAPLPQTITAYAWAPDSRSLWVAGLSPSAEARAARKRYGDVHVADSAIPEPGNTLSRVWLEASGAGGGLPRTASVESLGTFPHWINVIAPAAGGERVAWSTYPPAESRNVFADAEVWLREADGGVRQVTHNAMREGMVFSRPGLVWSADGRSLLVSAWGRESAESPAIGQWHLYRVGLGDGALQRIAGDFEGAFLGLQGLADGSLLTVGVRSTAEQAYRVKPDTGEVALLSSGRGRVWLPTATPRGDAVAFVYGDRERFAEIHVAPGLGAFARSRPVTEFAAALQALPLPEVETVSWDNGEGTRIEGVLWWPPGQRGAGPLPMVLDLHGGPWLARAETVGLAAPSAYVPALLASRGYLVLCPNHRGSAGRGDAFVQAIQDHPCSVPTTDVMAGVDALVARGWADPQRLGVMGHSWGGTLANCLVSRSDRFRAACSDAGTWNFTSALGSPQIPWDWGFLFSADAPWLDARYWSESPIAGAARLTTPTLVTVGEHSGRVAVSQARELYRALRFAGVPSRLMVFPGEHELIAQPKHQRAKLEAELEWLDRWLGMMRE